MLSSQTALRNVIEAGRWLSGARTRYRVDGPSMEPTLRPGEQVLVDPAGEPEVGGLVIAVHPDDPAILVIKRVASRRPDGSYVLSSDNPDGTDSRRWGPVPADGIRGRVTMILDRPMAPLDPPTDERSGTGRRADPTTWARWLRR